MVTLPFRRQQIEEEVKRLSIDTVFWPAIVLPFSVKASISRSHKQIVRWAKQHQLPDITIAEDDCVFTSVNSWRYFNEHIPDDYDLFLGNHYSGIKHPDNSITSFAGLTIYKVASRFFDTFLAVNELRNIDRALSGLGKFYVCSPEIAKQRSGYSYNRRMEVNDDHYLEGRKFLTD